MVIFVQDNSTQFTTTSISTSISSPSVFALTTNLNSLSQTSTLSINNLNSTSNTIFNNLNSLSQSSTLSINNLNSTSNTIFNNLNSLSGRSFFLTNYTNLSALNVSGTTRLNGATTCTSSLNVAGLALLNRIATYNDTSPDFTAVNNATTHSIINVFPGINGQQGALTADAYNINLNSLDDNYHLMCKNLYDIIEYSDQRNTKLYIEAFKDNRTYSVLDHLGNEILFHYWKTKIIDI